MRCITSEVPACAYTHYIYTYTYRSNYYVYLLANAHKQVHRIELTSYDLPSFANTESWLQQFFSQAGEGSPPFAYDATTSWRHAALQIRYLSGVGAHWH